MLCVLAGRYSLRLGSEEELMKRRFLSIVALAALVALSASAAMAHGDKKHVIGTLEKT